MVAAIGQSPYPSQPGSGASAAALQARLDRYQQQLSDSVNCASAKTSEGQKNIQEISGKISEVKSQIIQSTATGGANFSSGDSQATRSSAASTVGSRVDVFA